MEDKNHGERSEKLLEEILAEISKVKEAVRRDNANEYEAYLKEPQRLLTMNFILGLMRGLGMAVGFTILGAIVLYMLKEIIVLNLPVISNFIADIVRLVQQQGI